MDQVVTQDAAPEDLETPNVSGKIALRVQQLIAIKAKKKALKKLFETEEKPLTEMENLLSAAIMKFLIDNPGIENVRTVHGTCFKRMHHSASLSNPDEFMRHVIGTQAFELLDRKANVTAVRAYAAENDGNLPPGVNLTSVAKIGVHKKSGAAQQDGDD